MKKILIFSMLVTCTGITFPAAENHNQTPETAGLVTEAFPEISVENSGKIVDYLIKYQQNVAQDPNFRKKIIESLKQLNDANSLKKAIAKSY
ncbi:MAG: hypothetical protein V1855_04225, partial [bacterium]